MKETRKQQQIKKIIKEAITNEAVYEYFTASWGEKLGVYRDGSITVGADVGKEIIEDERPIAVISCPGLGNIDTTYWVEGWTTYNENSGEYIVDETGERIDFAECIYRTCMDGDIFDETEGIIQALIEDYLYDVEQAQMYMPKGG